YESLPESLKKDKTVMLNRLRASQAASDDVYQEALEDYTRLFPGDPSIDLQSIDANLLKKKYDDAIACVDRLDRAVGGDGFLDSIRSNIKLTQGDLEAAKTFIEKAIAANPENIDFYWQRVGISLKENNFDNTLKYLNAVEEQFHPEFDDLSQIDDYAGFVKSPQYQEWLKLHPRP